jgi:hypothetical protein
MNIYYKAGWEQDNKFDKFSIASIFWCQINFNEKGTDDLDEISSSKKRSKKAEE